MRVVIAAGGTAGHVVPALAVADELRSKGAAVSFIGATGKMEEEIVPRAGYEIDTVAVTGIDRGNPIRAAAAIARAFGALSAARRILNTRSAEVLLGGGGYVVGPAGVAALGLGIPLVLTEADRHLGLANRLLARRAKAVCLAYPLPGLDKPPYKVTGRPVPRAVLSADRDSARARFGIGPGRKVLLVMGGSQGAKSINEAALGAFGSDSGRGFHVIHLAGSRDYPWLREQLIEQGAHEYTLLEYEADLGDCLAASDLVVARSGGSIFEVMAHGLPAILIPYPHAAANHQALNAEWMEASGAARSVADADLDSARLADEVQSILDDPVARESMASASAGLAMPEAAATVADFILDQAERRSSA